MQISSRSEELPLFSWRTPVAPPPPPPPGPVGISLRPYQLEAVDGARKALADKRSTLIVMPTGTGKTTVFGYIANRASKRVLILAHREELIFQASDRLREMGAFHVGIDKAELAPSLLHRLVVGSVPTLRSEGRLKRYPADHFGLIIVDEAHHAPADSYRRIVDHFKAAKVIGVTATPDRADGTAMGTIFDSVAFDYPINDAIRDGWLCDIRMQAVFVDSIDLSRVRTDKGDLHKADLAKVMQTEESLHGIARPTLELAAGRRTIVFADSVDNAERLAEIMCRYEPRSARFISGKTPTDERQAILAAHKSGVFKVLINVAVLTEGYDDPAVACIAIARPTKSRALYTQMVGRGLRKFPGKDDCLILDFCGNAGKHQLVSPVDILGGKYDDEVRQRAKHIAQKAKGSLLTGEALAKAAAEIEAEKLKAAARRIGATAEVKYRAGDPFEVYRVNRDSLPAAGQSMPATVRQLAALSDEGMKVDSKNLTFGEAKKLLDTVHVRKWKGLASYKQLKTLASAGIRDVNIRKATASRLIEALFTNKQATGKWELSPAQVAAARSGRQPGEEG